MARRREASRLAIRNSRAGAVSAHATCLCVRFNHVVHGREFHKGDVGGLFALQTLDARPLLRSFLTYPSRIGAGRVALQHVSPRTGSPEAVAHLRLPQNVACRFPAPRSSDIAR